MGGYPFENHIAGQRVIQLFPAHHRHRSQCRPDAGLDRKRGLSTRKSSTSGPPRCPSLSEPSPTTATRTTRPASSRSTSATPCADFTGSPASRIVHSRRQQHQVARHGRGGRRNLCRVVPLTQAAAVGDFTIKGTSIYTQLVPSAQTETPIFRCAALRVRRATGAGPSR